MGSLYLLDLAQVCRSTGRPVHEVEGWTSRARGSGGYNTGKPDHVAAHHTASGPAADGWPDVDYICFGDSDAPLANLYLGRQGEIWVCAAGATNTNGSGTDPCGLIADDTLNSSAIGIEAGNDGVGEPWPQPQQDCYVALCAALCHAYGIGFEQVHAHFEWTSRKIDPAGPSRWATSGSWDMDGFRDDCSNGTVPAPPTPSPAPPEEEDMPRFLVAHPSGEWFVTDMATYRTYVPHPGLGEEGMVLFGWEGQAGGPWQLGAGWAPYLDQLPRTEA